MSRLLIAFLACVTLLACQREATHDTVALPSIAAAADLKFALEEIAARYKDETGVEVRLSFGSSGNFYTQLSQGAPFEMFLSADEGFVRKLAEAGKTMDEGRLYAIGRVVLFAPEGSPLKAEEGVDGLRRALAAGTLKRFAIANPEHAPYGRAAREALKSQDLWEQIEPLLVLGENVSQAAQFATSGSTQGGIFAYSLALSPSVGGKGAYVLLPDSWHEPLRQRMVLMKKAGADAKAFFAYIQTPEARTTFRRYGFVLPDEKP